MHKGVKLSSGTNKYCYMLNTQALALVILEKTVAILPDPAK